MTWVFTLGLTALPAMATTNRADSGTGNTTSAGKANTEVFSAKGKTSDSSEANAPAKTEPENFELELTQLRDLLREQSKQLEAEREMLREQQARIRALEQRLNLDAPATSASSAAGTALSPGGARAADINGAASSAAPVASVQEVAQKQHDLEKKLDGVISNLGGFKLSGDFRLRADAQLRSSNSVASPLQNVRARYRLRVNVDKDIDKRFKFHLQLSTGALNNPLTNDQDFTSTAVKHPFSISEGYVDFHPNSRFSIRGGRTEEVFADNMRFVWDDDVRFNGFHQIWNVPFSAHPLGFKSIEFRVAEYFLTNPNVVVLSDTSPLVSAGYKPGQKVRDAKLFHPGFVLKGDLGSRWGQQFTADFQIYKNPNQIQLASLPSGFPILVSNGVGIALSGPVTGTGNATTTPGGAIYRARGFQIAHIAYRAEYKGLQIGHREMPFWLDVQASRNTGTSKLRDAVMGSVNLGSVKRFGDMRFLYQYAIKDANSLISQFTDDDLGTGTGVNIAVHAVRWDLGLTRFLSWQNLVFVQHERRPNNPADQFFVPLQRGANATYRYLGQLAFIF
jgi:hypothetical protein